MNMKKMIMTAAIAAAVAMTVTGCGSRRPIERNAFYKFQATAAYKDGWEIVDKDTGNAYFVFKDGGVVPLFDDNGQLHKANGWRDIGE